MSTSAIIMMISAMVTVWGGLAASAISLFRHPEQDRRERCHEPSRLVGRQIPVDGVCPLLYEQFIRATKRSRSEKTVPG